MSLGNFTVPNLENGGSTPNRGGGGEAGKVPDNSIVTVEGNSPGKEPRRAETLSEEGLPNFGVAGDDGEVDANGEFLLVEDTCRGCLGVG